MPLCNEDLNISYSHVELGAVVLTEKISKEKLKELAIGVISLHNPFVIFA